MNKADVQNLDIEGLLEHLCALAGEHRPFNVAWTEAHRRMALRAYDEFTRDTAIAEIAAERLRQIESEGHSLQHDDDHNCEQLRHAACALLDLWTHRWPEGMGQDKRPGKTYRRRLIIAAALLVAEIERVDRVASS